MDYKSLHQYCHERKVQLLAVSKTRTVEEIMALYDQGQRDFGENRVQEYLEKKEQLPSDIQWHIIGHLQTNKVKHLIPGISLIHSVDSLRLAQKINDLSVKADSITKILLQYKVAKEDSKFGLDSDEDLKLLDYAKNASHLNVNGIMGMGSFTSDQEILQTEFNQLIAIFDRLKSDHFSNKEDFQIKSIGMSGDYQLAIEHGSNMVRIGSLLFN